MKRVEVIRWSAAAAVVTVAVSASLYSWRIDSSIRLQVASQQQTIGMLQARVAMLENEASAQPDWSAIAAAIEPSVFTIETDASLGSAWVAHADANGSDLVTNFHVIAEAWSAGTATVQVRHGDLTSTGTIVRVDRNDDLAVVHVKERLAALTPAAQRPKLGATVMAIGSPLGLGGTVTLGVVSGFRSLEGSDYVQFSAPISPGNSGGPVVDSHGRVVAVASAKLIGTGVEALSLAIPVQVACLNLVTCSST
jgi:putative serine protease PepD